MNSQNPEPSRRIPEHRRRVRIPIVMGGSTTLTDPDHSLIALFAPSKGPLSSVHEKIYK